MKRKRKITLPRSIQKCLILLLFTLLSSGLYWGAEKWMDPPLPSSHVPAQFYSIPGKEDLRLTFEKALSQAQESILLIIYALTEERMIAALNQKSAAGVSVRLIIHGKEKAHLRHQLHPNIETLYRFGPSLMHQKILVIDRHQVWVGSANMTPESLHMHANLVVGFESASLARHIAEKANAFEEVGYNQTLFPHHETLVGNQKVEFSFLPDDRQATSRIKQLIASAEKTIRVAMFTWTRRDFAQALVSAKKRGVKVEVLLDNKSSQGASRSLLKFLQQQKIAVRLNQGSALLHHKMMIIDDQILVNGSANWTKNAFSENDDCFMILHALTKEQREQLDAMWEEMKRDSVAAK